MLLSSSAQIQKALSTITFNYPWQPLAFVDPKHMQTSRSTLSPKKNGRGRTALCPPACWEGLFCAWHQHGLQWPDWLLVYVFWAAERSGARRVASVAEARGAGPLFARLVDGAAAHFKCYLPNHFLHRKWQGHPALGLKDPHLPHFARLSHPTQKGGGGGGRG